MQLPAYNPAAQGTLSQKSLSQRKRRHTKSDAARFVPAQGQFLLGPEVQEGSGRIAQDAQVAPGCLDRGWSIKGAADGALFRCR